MDLTKPAPGKEKADIVYRYEDKCASCIWHEAPLSAAVQLVWCKTMHMYVHYIHVLSPL